MSIVKRMKDKKTWDSSGVSYDCWCIYTSFSLPDVCFHHCNWICRFWTPKPKHGFRHSNSSSTCRLSRRFLCRHSCAPPLPPPTVLILSPLSPRAHPNPPILLWAAAWVTAAAAWCSACFFALQLRGLAEIPPSLPRSPSPLASAPIRPPPSNRPKKDSRELRRCCLCN